MSLQHMTGDETIAMLRRIVSRHSAMKINQGGHRPVWIDVITAHAIVTVFDALNDENRAKFSRMDIGSMARIAWKCVR